MLLAASLCLSNIGAAPAQEKRDALMRSVDSANLMKSNTFAVPKGSSVLERHAGDRTFSNGKTGKSLFTGHIQLNRSSPPEAGIRLLQDILQRVRNVPQIAMAKPKYQTEQNTLNVQQAAQGPTDYRLAIRPQEIATPPALQPEIKKGSNVIAWSDMPKIKLDSSVASGGDNPDYGTVTTGDSQLSGKKGFWERDGDALGKNRNQKAKDAKEAKEAGAPAGNAADDSVGGYGYSNAQGIWERERAKAEAAVNKLSPESRQRLSSSANKLFNLAQGLEAAQQSVERKQALPASDEESKSRGAVLTASKSKWSSASSFRAEKERPSVGARKSQMLAAKQNINDFRSPLAMQSYGGYAGGGAGYAGNETNVRGHLASSHAMSSQPVPMSAGRSLKTPSPESVPAPAPMPRAAGAASSVVPVDNFYADQSASFRRNDPVARRE